MWYESWSKIKLKIEGIEAAVRGTKEKKETPNAEKGESEKSKEKPKTGWEKKAWKS